MGSTAVFRRSGGGEMPFYEGGAGDEGHVVEVVDGEVEGEAHFAGFGDEGHGKSGILGVWSVGP